MLRAIELIYINGQIKRRLSFFRTPSNVFKLYLLISVIVAVVTLPVAINLAPWLQSAPVPFLLHLDAPGSTQAKICWDQKVEECLPLVPYATTAGEAINLWLGELPPRPAYHLTVLFQSPLKRAALHGLTLIDVRRVDVPIYNLTSDTSSAWFVSQGIRSAYVNQAFLLDSEASSRISIPGTINLAPRMVGSTTIALWFCLVAALLLAIALFVPLFKYKTAFVNASAFKSPNSSTSLWVAFGVATVIHVLLIINAPVVLAGGDSMIYLLKAVALVQRRTYDLGGYEYELNRLPGYPILLALIFKLFGYQLSIAALIQALMFSVSVLLLLLSLRKWIHPTVGVVAVFVAILSPAQIWASRTMLAESTFGTFCMLALAAFFTHIRTTGIKSKVWLIIYAFLATCAFFIRPNGIALFAALIPAYVPIVIGIIARKASIAEKITSIFRFSIPYIAAMIIFLTAIAGWSVRNYYNRGYLGASDMTGVTLICGLIVSGTFDINSLAQTNLYDQYLTHKYKQGYYYPGYHLRHDLYLQLSENQQKLTNNTLSQLDSSLQKLAAVSKRLSPWQVNVIGLLRTGWWAIRWPDIEAYSKEGIRLDYVTFENNCAIRRGGSCPSIQELKQTFFPYISDKIIYDERSPSLSYSIYASFAELYYNGWYILLSILALIGALYLLWRGNVVLAAPIFIFMANIILNTYLLNVFSRYIHILDVFLVFQFALGISLYLNKIGATQSAANTVDNLRTDIHRPRNVTY